jgi:CheY-like chemotaxis protein
MAAMVVIGSLKIRFQSDLQVDAAANGEQALAAFGKHHPDALVLDLEMPVMDGPTLVRTLRERTKWALYLSSSCLAWPAQQTRVLN